MPIKRIRIYNINNYGKRIINRKHYSKKSRFYGEMQTQIFFHDRKSAPSTIAARSKTK